MPCALCGSDLHDRSACPWREYACSASNRSQQSALDPWSWVWQWAAGWATGWQQGATRAASRMQHGQPLRLRTPLLKLQIERLKLNTHAQYKRSNHAPAHLYLLRR